MLGQFKRICSYRGNNEDSLTNGVEEAPGILSLAKKRVTTYGEASLRRWPLGEDAIISVQPTSGFSEHFIVPQALL